MNTANITAATLVKLHTLAISKPLSREYGEALAQAMLEASAPAKASTAAIRPGQVVMINGKTRARVLEIARNGVWIIRSATDGEWLRGNHIGGQVKERISIKAVAAI
jgi:hypothetical protein